jgi:hypothetical protein
MRLVVIAFLDTERKPQEIADEIVSNLDFDNQVLSVVVLTEDGKEVGNYDKNPRL